MITPEQRLMALGVPAALARELVEQFDQSGNRAPLLAVKNLSDLKDVLEARNNLGLGTAATKAAEEFATSAQGAMAETAVQPEQLDDALEDYAPLESPAFTGTVTGITKSMVGLGNVDNTSDADKPVSVAQQAALDLKANTADLASTDPGKGAALVGFKQDGTGAVARTVEDKAREWVSVKDFGAVGDGVADDTAAIQAAIDYCESLDGGVVIFSQGQYKISQTLICNKGILLEAGSLNNVSSITNGDSGVKARIAWYGALNGTMLKIVPAVVGDIVFGGGVKNIEFDGMTDADYAVVFDNTKFAVFSGNIRNVRKVGLTICSDSGSTSNFSMKNRVERLSFVWGTSDVCKDADGLHIRGGGTSIPGTQQYVDSVFGLMYNGSLVVVAQTDNAQLYSVHGSVQSGGSGRSLKIMSGTPLGGTNTTQYADNNVIYYVTGKIFIENGTSGNVFVHYNNEKGGIEAAGASNWHGSLIDCLSGEMYESHKYALRERLLIKSGDFVPGSGITTTEFGLQWVCYSFPDAVTSKISCSMRPPKSLNNGFISSINLILGKNGTGSGNFVVGVKLSTGIAASRIITPQKTEVKTLAPGAQNEGIEYTFDFSASPLEYTKNLPILVTIYREGANASDTNTDALIFVGASIEFVAKGPVTTGAGNPAPGTYYIPGW